MRAVCGRRPAQPAGSGMIFCERGFAPRCRYDCSAIARRGFLACFTSSSVARSSSSSESSAAPRFSSRCATDDVPGMSRTWSPWCSSQASATCEVVTPCFSATLLIAGSADRLRAAGEGRAKREVRDERDPALGAEAQSVFVLAKHDAVGVLHLAELDELQRGLGLGDGCVADADRLDLALLAEVFHRAELVGQRDVGSLVAVHQAQVDQGERLDAERCEVGFTPARSSSGRSAGSHAPAASRRAPTFETTRSPSGYGCSASRMSWLTTSGP